MFRMHSSTEKRFLFDRICGQSGDGSQIGRDHNRARHHPLRHCTTLSGEEEQVGRGRETVQLRKQSI